MASLAAEHGLTPGLSGFSNCGTQALERRLSSCGAWAWLVTPQREGIFPDQGLNLFLSPALECGFFTTEPPGKPQGN